MYKPYIGQPINVRNQDTGEVSAAIITKVWNDTTVNATEFPDGFAPVMRSSLTLAQPGTLSQGEFQWPTVHEVTEKPQSDPANVDN